MATIRVDHAALAMVAEQLRVLPERLGATRQDVADARGAMASVGDAGAAAVSDELLRQLGWFVDMAALTTAGLTRAVLAAAGDYATADQAAVRFEGA
jgi:hypothetical protein